MKVRLVVDTNVWVTFFWKNAVFKKLVKNKDLELYAPIYALEEINKHRDEIRKKAKIATKVFKELRKELVGVVDFIPLKEYRLYLKKAATIGKHLLEEEYKEWLNDIDFIALSIALDCPVWSHDKLLQKQENKMIVTTKEVIACLDQKLD